MLRVRKDGEGKGTSGGGEKCVSFDGDFCGVERFCWRGESSSGEEIE